MPEPGALDPRHSLAPRGGVPDLDDAAPGQDLFGAFRPELVRRALPGMVLSHLPVPPAALSPRVDFQYFGVNREGPCWDDIAKVKKVGVYVPGDLPDPEVELFALLES